MQSRDLKYLSYGFGIGALLAGLFFAGWLFVQSTQHEANAASGGSLFGVPETPTQIALSTPSPSATATITVASTVTLIPTATATSTPTLTPSPTATLTEAEMMIANGDLTITGPLTREQQVSLYEASLTFIAPTLQESKQMSVAINQLRFSDPSTTCGPLSIAILQKAGILSQDLVPHDFFLINPDLKKDRLIIESVFTKERFTDTRRKVRIDQEDWAANPLMPGDFVYLYAGTGGNFEHMLVVNRVDSLGRTYSVTNYNTEQGFVIDEALLYDPADANAGMFSKWTEKQFAKLGSTGYSGYEVWRLIQ